MEQTMNMISTGSFLTETSASNKQSELVKTLTAAWEKKNSKAARAGGVSLMALSLAACGSSEDTTPFSQADVDAAKAEGVASVDITSDNATAMTSNDAEIAAAAKTAALTAANGTVYPTVDQAFTAGSNQSNADAVTAALTAADGTVYATVDAAVTAGADGVDITTDNQAAIDAELAGSGFASVDALLAAYNDAIAATPAISAVLTTSADIVEGTSNDDSVTGTHLTYGTGDAIIGGAGDDTLTIAMTGNNAGTATVAGIENIIVNATSFSTVTFDAAGIAGGTITFNNLQSGGATSGTVNNVLSNVTVQSGSQMTGTLTVDLGADAEGVTVDGGSSSGGIAVTDAGNGSVTVLSTKAGTTASPVTISVDGAGDSTLGTADDAASVSAAGVVTLETAASNQVENLTISGNGAAVTYNLDATGDAPETVTFSGSQDVTIAMEAVQALTETFIDSSTAGTMTLKIDDDIAYDNSSATSIAATTTDLTEVASSIVIDIADDTNGTATGAALYDVANAATVKITTTVSANGMTIQSSDNSASSESISIDIDDAATFTGALTVSDFEVVNLSTSDSSATAGDSTVTMGDIDGSNLAGSVINVTGSTDLTLTGGDTTHLNAAEFEGDLVATIAADLTKITGGSGDDRINVTDQNLTLVGGDGTDTLAFAATTNLSDNTVSLSGFEKITLNYGGAAGDVAETVTIKGSVLDGQSYIVSGTGATNNDILSVTMDATDLDLSSLAVNTNLTQVTITNVGVKGLAQTIKGSNAADTLTDTGTGAINIEGNGGADVITTAGGVDTIDGGSGDDNITAGAGADSVTGGEGADEIVTAGGDTVILTETTSAGDNVVFAAIADGIGSAVGVATQSFSGYNVITGFTTSVDDLVFDSGNAFNGDNIDTAIIQAAGAFVIASTAATSDANDLAVADYADVDSVVAFLSDGAYTSTGNTHVNLAAITFDDFTAVYSVTDATTGGDILAGEVRLIATVDEVLVSGDIVIA
jgi:hypothetical protein